MQRWLQRTTRTLVDPRFLRPVLGMACCMGMAVLAVELAWGQTGSQRLVVTEEIAFSWPIVCLIVVSALGYGGVVLSVKQHHASQDIHLTLEKIGARHRTREECVLEHGAIGERLKLMQDTLNDIQRLLMKGE